MKASIEAIIDHMFKDTADTAETRALHEELLNNCLEHYDDLIGRGMSETEAIDAVVDSLKGMKEVIDEYPKKRGAAAPEKETKEETVPEIHADAYEKEQPAEEKPSEFTCDAAGIYKLKTDLKNCDLKIGCSRDNRIHVRCEDMEQIRCDLDGNTLSVKLVDKAKKSIEEESRKLNSQDFTMKNLLNFIGKAIGTVASNLTVSWDVYIDLPSDVLEEMDLNAKSGDIEVKAKMPEKLTAHNMSGDVTIDAIDNDPAGRVTVSAMSGEIEFRGCAGNLSLSSMSGDVEACGRYQTAELKSTSGDVDLVGEAETIRMSSVSGDVGVDLRSASARSLQARSTSGDVDIDLPSGADSVHVQMSTVSGSTHCSIPDSGSGAALQIIANSVSGDVTVK